MPITLHKKKKKRKVTMRRRTDFERCDVLGFKVSKTYFSRVFWIILVELKFTKALQYKTRFNKIK
jgi:hypothetical protein